MTKTADQTPPAFVLLNEIGIINQLSSARFEALLPEGLNQPQFSVLNNFARLGGTRTPAQLAAAFQVTRGAMTNTLKRLEDKGFIEIQPSEIDGRSKEISITRQGLLARDEAIRATAPELDRLVEAFSTEEIERVLPFLQHLRHWLDTHR